MHLCIAASLALCWAVCWAIPCQAKAAAESPNTSAKTSVFALLMIPFPSGGCPRRANPKITSRAPNRRLGFHLNKGGRVSPDFVLGREARARPNAIVGRCDVWESTKPRAETPSPVVVISYDKAGAGMSLREYDSTLPFSLHFDATLNRSNYWAGQLLHCCSTNRKAHSVPTGSLNFRFFSRDPHAHFGFTGRDESGITAG